MQNLEKRRWNNSFGLAALLALVFGLISIPLAPIIYVAGMYSIIGIPLAIIAILFPTLCLAIVIAYIVWRIIFFRLSGGIAYAFIVAISMMLVVPQIYNQIVVSDVKALLSNDTLNVVEPIKKDEVLVVFKQRSATNYCDVICVELLLTEQVTAYAGGKLPRASSRVSSDAEVLVHRIVDSSRCGDRKIYLHGERWKKTQQGTVANMLALAEKRGKCIQSTKMPLAQIGTHRLVTFANGNHLDHRSSAFLIDTQIRPWRFNVFESGNSVATSSIYQHTTVSYSKLQPLLAYSVGDFPSSQAQLWRKPMTLPRPKLKNYMTSVLGARLQSE